MQWILQWILSWILREFSCKNPFKENARSTQCQEIRTIFAKNSLQLWWPKTPYIHIPKTPPQNQKIRISKNIEGLLCILFAAKSEGTCCHSLFHHGKEIFRTSASQSSSQSQRQKNLEATQYRPGVLSFLIHYSLP